MNENRQETPVQISNRSSGTLLIWNCTPSRQHLYSLYKGQQTMSSHCGAEQASQVQMTSFNKKGCYSNTRKLFWQTKKKPHQPSSPHSLNHKRKSLINLFFFFSPDNWKHQAHTKHRKTSCSFHTTFGIHTCLSISHPHKHKATANNKMWR